MIISTGLSIVPYNQLKWYNTSPCILFIMTLNFLLSNGLWFGILHIPNM